jgi:hypothetical protein
MTLSADLIHRYETYLSEGEALFTSAKVTDGLFGFGDDPKRDPMHAKFFEDVAALAQEMADSSPSPQEAQAAVGWMLSAEETAKEFPTLSWMMVAAQQHVLPLVPYLTPEGAASLLREYDRRYPRRLRLPIQNQVAKALKKQSRG